MVQVHLVKDITVVVLMVVHLMTEVVEVVLEQLVLTVTQTVLYLSVVKEFFLT